MKKKMMMMLLTATMVFSLVGCGSKGAEAPEADTAETADDAESADADATDAETSDSGKKWIIATDTAFKPFEYKDDSGEYVGIDVDILAAIAEDQGFDYDLQALGWDASIAACQAGQADGMIAGAFITDERKNSGWIFSDGYYDANQSMAVAENSSITGFADLNGKTVAVKTGSMSAEYAESLKDEYGFTVTTFEDSPTMYQAVVGGQVDAVFDDTPIMASNIKDNGLAMKLVDMFNAGLANIKANGTYDEIIAKYLGE